MLERLLIVGLGSIGKRHTRLARDLFCPSAEIVALRHRDSDGDLPMGIDHCVSSLDAAIEFGPQAAVVANPATHHLEVALPLAKAGVHLMIEKPISHESRGVHELISLCEAGGLTLMTGYNLRHMSSLQKFRDYIKEERVGRVISVRAEVGQFLPLWRVGTDYRQSVSARAELGGGVLLELSHEIDYLRWLLGEVEWVNATLSRNGGLEIDVEDTAHLVMGFAPRKGAAPVVASLNMDFIRHDRTRTCVAIGEAGSLRWNGIDNTVDVLDQGEDRWQSLFTMNQQGDSTYIAEWRDFLTCIQQSNHPVVSGYDGLAALHVIEAARRSSEDGCVVFCRTEKLDSIQ